MVSFASFLQLQTVASSVLTQQLQDAHVVTSEHAQQHRQRKQQLQRRAAAPVEPPAAAAAAAGAAVPHRQWPGVTVVLPVKGCRSHSLENWMSHVAMDYDGPREYLFVLESESDPAFNVLQPLLTHHPAASAPSKPETTSNGCSVTPHQVLLAAASTPAIRTAAAAARWTQPAALDQS
ncbi:MAG: hypothetical protein WDW38_000141 [Sanguina aurantia]